jgi:catechol 2,3-dioxygenase-like lactoylglutathione lyase family enzyme
MREGSYSIRLDSVQIGVADLEEGVCLYTTLLGGTPTQQSDQSVRYQLPIGAVELVSGGSGLQSLTFTYADALPAYGGESVPLRFVADRDNGPHAPACNGVVAIDHVVVHSDDLDRAGRVYGDQLGLRLALDRAFPERGLRILFFRNAGITLEVVGSLTSPAEPGADRLYGLTYRVADLVRETRRLELAGVNVSPIRTGFKPGTSVATVRSGTAGIPTLLLHDPSRTT